MRILLVEDDAVLRDVMLRSLADAGHRVDVSTNVEDARRLTCTASPRGGQLGVERESNSIRSHEAKG